MNDGTQERTLDPPDNMLSDAELRECERAAREGWDERDERSLTWLCMQLADTPHDVCVIVHAARANARFAAKSTPLITQAVSDLRDRYIAECAEEYWGDLIEQEKYAQEP